MNTRCISKVALRFTAMALFLVAPTFATAQPAKPPAVKLTDEERQLLRQRDQLLNRARFLDRNGKLDEALAVAEEVLAIERSVLGMVHQDVADRLAWIAGLRRKNDQFDAALKRHDELIPVLEALFGKDDWRVIDAKRWREHAQKMKELSPAQRVLVRHADELIGHIIRLRNQRQVPQALWLVQKLLKITKDELGNNHFFHAFALNEYGVLLYHGGDYFRAESAFRESLKIREDVLGEKHPQTAQSLNNLAECCQAMGNFAEAEPLFRQALDIRKELLGVQHGDYATCLNNLGNVYLHLGHYAKAKPLLHQAADIYKKHNDARLAVILNNLAALYSYLGDSARSDALTEQALVIFGGVYGKTHPDYAACLLNAASDYILTKKYAKAKERLEQASNILKTTHRGRYALCLDMQAAVLYRAGKNFAKAEPLLRDALDIIKKDYGDKHHHYATTLHNLATLYLEKGDYTQAGPLYEQSRVIAKEVYGERHATYAGPLQSLGLLYAEMGNLDKALSWSRQSLTITRGHLDDTFPAMSERQQREASAKLRIRLDEFLSYASHAGRPAAEPYAHVLAWKGAVLARQMHTRSVVGEGKLADRFEELRRVTWRVAKMALSVPPPQQRSLWLQALEKLTEKKEQLEAELARDSQEFRQRREAARLTPRQLQQALPRKTALVDLFEYLHGEPPKAKKGPLFWRRRLAAFVVRRDALDWIDLGEAATIHATVRRWREAVEDLERPDAAMARKLRGLLWEKLEKPLEGAKTVLISPDGPLANFPWAALPGREPGSFLIEERAVAIVPVPQMLPRLLAEEPGKASGGVPSLLVLGNVKYDADAGMSNDRLASWSAVGDPASEKLWRFDVLDSTQREMAKIAGYFKQRFPKRIATQLSQDARIKPTESAFRAQAPRHRWLHLATHGFFAPPKLKSALAPRKEDERQNLLGQSGVTGFHPGLLSGLALNGANTPPKPGQDDGILTALEVAALDLRNVDMAVLSACETGLGQVAGGEGVLGLQRAFQLAGARSTVTSLWKVQDAATEAFMSEFYKNLWQKKLGKLEALQQAQMKMIVDYVPKEGKLRAGTNDRPISPKVVADARNRLKNGQGLSPFYWAAFVLAGDWR